MAAAAAIMVFRSRREKKGAATGGLAGRPAEGWGEKLSERNEGCGQRARSGNSVPIVLRNQHNVDLIALVERN